MTTNFFPDDATLCAALELAGRAPSIHNTQPWEWRVGSHSLNLYSRLDLRLPHTDPDCRDLIVSCGGAALHHATVALAALGWRASVHRIPNPDDPPEHLASVEVHRGSPTEADIAMAAAIPRRRTDRRIYSSWPVAMGGHRVDGCSGGTPRCHDAADRDHRQVCRTAGTGSGQAQHGHRLC